VDWEASRSAIRRGTSPAQLDNGEALFRTMLSRYGPADSRLEHRARRLSAMREFSGVRHAARMGDETELAEAVAKLRRSSILAGH
jgi:hypothetical protein